MAIGGEKRIGEVEGKHWDKFAGVVGRDPDDVRARVRRLAEAIPEAFAQAVSELPESVEGRELVESEVLPRIRALDEQTVKGLAVSRRVGSRVITPLLDTLEG